MTTNDGSVLGTTQIVDHGPVSRRFNLVITCDGYQAAQMTQFANDAHSFVDKLFATTPFEAVQGAFNVFRIDVVSTDAGADDPTTCTGGTGATVATFFDASFCSDGARRALHVNNQTVLSVVNQQVPQHHAIVVIVNSPIYGGTGGQIGVFSLASDATEIGIHELGHTAFGFADEYEYLLGCGEDTDRDHHGAGEPAEPNVTTTSDRNTIKWADLILPATPMPTTSNADCTKCDPQGNPVSASTVGAFEGADTFHCGAFRAQFDCKMRTLGKPFCAVCQRRIRATMEPFMPRRWFHLSPVAGHPMEADLDASALGIPARFAVAADFDDDGIPELAVGMQSAGSAGNDLWVYAYDVGAQTWNHLSPIAGHPLEADIDCSTLGFPCRFAVTGDFDGDGTPELAMAIEATGSGGNDFWVMKYDPGAQAWPHLSPIAGHPLEADFDCSTLAFPARFALAGDFDGDGADELLVAPDLDDGTATGVTGGGGPGPAPTDSRGNDLWVMKYHAGAHAWTHLSPIAGHPMEADLDCSALGYWAKFAVAGDFDGDGADEVVVAPFAASSAGNDLWVFKFDPVARTWGHLSPIAGHPMEADIDCSTLGSPAKLAVVGDFDGDGAPELAIAIGAAGSGGNDFWVMKYDAGAHAWTHLSPIAGHPLEADLDCSTLPFPARFAVAGDFDGDGVDELAVAPDAGGTEGNDFWVLKYDPYGQAWYHLTPIAGHAMEADVDCARVAHSARFAVVGDFDDDGEAELAVAPAASSSAGNDFWVMALGAVEPPGDNRAVTQTGKGADGTIVSLCYPGAPWAPRSKQDAIADIKARSISYYVPWGDGRRAAIRVVAGPAGEYLRTDWDRTPANNLTSLPDC